MYTNLVLSMLHYLTIKFLWSELFFWEDILILININSSYIYIMLGYMHVICRPIASINTLYRNNGNYINTANIICIIVIYAIFIKSCKYAFRMKS